MISMPTNPAADSVLSQFARSEPVQKKEDDLQGRFLTLLTTQLRNQDPMNPMENAELTSQLAQMSTVDGIERLNKMVQSFFEERSSIDEIGAAALIGRGVLVEGRGLMLTEAGAVGGFEIDGPADEVTLSIRDSSGLVVNELVFSGVEAGSHNFVWDGTAQDGTRAADGLYTMSFSASQGSDKVAGRSLQFGAVSSIVRGPQGSDLQVGDLGVFKLDDIRQIL
ncbi:MAG: flagellar hook assembly protein FlgD [Thauera sp.]|jgi:flagellar basal-body rod modification protein FlgD|nr:flagellar hook assembly protein FlgD [Thauera sp.]